MSAYVVLRDALMACGVPVERFPGEDAPEAVRRQMLVPVLRQHRDDESVRLVAPTVDGVGWAVACLSTSERKAKFHDAVLKVLASGLHPSGARIQLELRGRTTASEGLNGEECKWRTELLVAMGWTPPPAGLGSNGKWLPPGQVRRIKHRWRQSRDSNVATQICHVCGVARWMDLRGRWVWAANVDGLQLGHTIARNDACAPKEAP